MRTGGLLLLGKRIFLIVPSLAPCHPERQRRVPVEMLRCAQHDMTLGCLKVSASLRSYRIEAVGADLTCKRRPCHSEPFAEFTLSEAKGSG